jgi:hypothetical protein
MYSESDQQAKARENAFTYHKPFGDQQDRYVMIRETAKALSAVFNQNCPMSRELALAQTKLQEAVMWANSAIACNENSIG